RGLEELLHRGDVVVSERRDAEAGQDAHRLGAVRDARALEALPQALRDADGLLPRSPGQDHRKQRLAGAAHRVLGAQHALKQLDETPEQLTEGRFAEFRLDLGVVVDAQADRRERRALLAGLREVLRALLQEVAGGKGAGEPIPHLLVVVDLESLVARLEVVPGLHQAQLVIDACYGLDAPDLLADEVACALVESAAARRTVLVAAYDAAP